MPVSKSNLTLNSTLNYSEPVSLNLDRSLLDQGVIRGYAATFANGFQPGAFAASLEYWRACDASPHMTWCADPSDVVGRWSSCLEDGHGLLVTGRLALGTERGERIRQELRNGIDGLSAFFQIKTKIGGKIVAAHLSEVSLMRGAEIPEDKSAQPLKFANVGEFEGWLREKGVAKAAARKLASGGWAKLSAGADETSEAEAIEALSKMLGAANHQFETRRI